MRIDRFLPIALASLAAALNGQTIDGTLKWARENIDAHAMMSHFEPPDRSSGTRWQLTRIEGCSVELKQTSHREAPDSVVTADGVFGLSADKTVTWAFDLGALQPRDVMADTSTGLAHIKIFAEGDVFHLKTDSVSRTLMKDGSTAQTSTWSAPANARNLWMYFDSPGADNKLLVRKLEVDLRSAIHQCAPAK
jgi:hypothetical protein